jgi:hypothetical protein
MALALPAAYYAVTIGFTVVGGLIGGLIENKIGNI